VNDFHYLSKGCQLCQQGKWLCIYLTYKCNAACHFCPAPFKHDFILSAFGNQKEEILKYLNENDFESISFSGGDPFMVYDRLLDWFTYFKTKFPQSYYWVYTSGLQVNREKLKQLSEEGMDEIRFNIAATGYLSDSVLKKVETARELFPYVSVEIPSIKQDFNLLTKALSELDKIGIDYLNLHDYILSDSDKESTNEPFDTFILNKTIPIKFALSSIQNTAEIIRLKEENNYKFEINHCSMEQKELQMRQRRLKMGRIFSNPDCDFLMDDGLINNFYSLPIDFFINNMKSNLKNPDFLSSCELYVVTKNNIEELSISENKIIKASYIPQMEINQGKILLEIEEISYNEFINLVSDY
jgi:uncharacterized protein